MLDDSKISTLFSIAHKNCVYRNSVRTVPTILIMIYVGLKALAIPCVPCPFTLVSV